MKKIFLGVALLTLIASACKKKENDPSIVASVSFPTIALSNNGYFSIGVGGSLPSSSSVGSAYDSFYKAPYNLVLVDSTVNPLVPGMYYATAFATNKYGFVSSSYYWVAVTNLPSNPPNLAGNWQLTGASAIFNTTVSSIGNGYYSTRNFAGAADTSAGLTSANFALITDSTIAFTDANYGLTGTVSLATGDTTMSYSSLTFTKH